MVFYVKVSNDPESKPLPLQSRDYTALAGQENVADNLGNPYPCTREDLDYPRKRDTGLEAKDEMVKQRAVVADAVSGSPNTKMIGMGWTCPEIVGATTDTLWEHLCTMHAIRTNSWTRPASR